MNLCAAVSPSMLTCSQATCRVGKRLKSGACCKRLFSADADALRVSSDSEPPRPSQPSRLIDPLFADVPGVPRGTPCALQSAAVCLLHINTCRQTATHFVCGLNALYMNWNHQFDPMGAYHSHYDNLRLGAPLSDGDHLHPQTFADMFSPLGHLCGDPLRIGSL